MQFLHVARAVALLGQSGAGQSGRDVTLLLPHPPAHGETAWITIRVGAIGHARLQVTTSDGRDLGIISPYGVKAGTESGTYNLPVPAEAASNGRLTVRLTMLEGTARRAPTTQEVISVKAVLRTVP